jgi:hypothetical protein
MSENIKQTFSGFDLKKLFGVLMLVCAYVQTKPEVLDQLPEPWKTVAWHITSFTVWATAGTYVLSNRKPKETP